MTTSDHINAVKVISKILQSLEELHKDDFLLNSEEAGIVADSIKSIRDTQESFAARNMICIKHSEGLTTSADSNGKVSYYCLSCKVEGLGGNLEQ